MIVQESCQMYLFDSFRVCVNSERILLRSRFVTFKTFAVNSSCIVVVKRSNTTMALRVQYFTTQIHFTQLRIQELLF